MKKGDKVLINGVSGGGTGISASAPTSRQRGKHEFSIFSLQKLWAYRLRLLNSRRVAGQRRGADEVVDYKTTDVTQKYRNQDLDIVFDTIGEAAEVRARFLGHLNRIIWTIVGFFFGYQQFDSSKSPH